MAAREYMIAFRREHDVSIQAMAKICDVSQTLLGMLEADDQQVTHPMLAAKIGKKYRLTKAQIEGMLPENYRKSSPNYNPDKYKDGGMVWRTEKGGATDGPQETHAGEAHP